MCANLKIRDDFPQLNVCMRAYWCLYLGNIYRTLNKRIRLFLSVKQNKVFQNQSLEIVC